MELFLREHQKHSYKRGIAESVNFRKCRISALFAHTYIPRVFERKLEVKLNDAISDVQFNRSYKRGIAGSINFRKSRISARASQRVHKREVSSGAYIDMR